MKLFKKIIIPILIFLIFFFIYKKKAIDFKSLFYYDELAWVGRGYYLNLLTKNDFKNNQWMLYKVDGDPKLASYIYGLTIFPDYLKQKQKNNKDYKMFNFLIENKLNPFNYYDGILVSPAMKKIYEKYALNRKFDKFSAESTDSKSFTFLINKYGNEFKKTSYIILKARLASVIFLSLSVVIAYLISLNIFNNVILSLGASIFYGMYPLVLKYGLIVYTEPIFLFFINLGILLIIKIFTDKRHENIWLTFFVIVVSLTNQVKLNGIMLLVIFIGILIINLLVLKKDRFRNIKISFIKTFFLINLTVFFYILYDPSLYKNPIKNISFQYSFTNEIAKGQQKLWPKESLKTLKERFIYTNNYFFNQKNPLKPFTIFFIIGLIMSFINLIKSKKLTKENVMLIIFLGLYFPLLFFLMMAWERYLIHIVFFIYYFSMQGIIFTYNVIKRFYLYLRP